MDKQTKILGILSIILISSSVLDAYTAYNVTLPISEANPIYLYTHSFMFLVALSLLAIIYFIYSLKKSISIGRIFVLILAVFYLSFAHLVGMANNIYSYNQFVEKYGYQDHILKFTPELQKKIIPLNEAAIQSYKKDYQSQVSKSDQLWYYFIEVGKSAGIPFLLAVFSFNTAILYYNEKQPERDKIIDEIYRVSKKLVLK